MLNEIRQYYTTHIETSGGAWWSLLVHGLFHFATLKGGLGKCWPNLFQGDKYSFSAHVLLTFHQWDKNQPISSVQMITCMRFANMVVSPMLFANHSPADQTNILRSFVSHSNKGLFSNLFHISWYQLTYWLNIWLFKKNNESHIVLLYTLAINCKPLHRCI